MNKESVERLCMHDYEYKMDFENKETKVEVLRRREDIGQPKSVRDKSDETARYL